MAARDDDTKKISVPKRHLSERALRVSELNAAQLQAAAESEDPKDYAVSASVAISNAAHVIEQAWRDRVDKLLAYIRELEDWADAAEPRLREQQQHIKVLREQNQRLRDQIRDLVGR